MTRESNRCNTAAAGEVSNGSGQLVGIDLEATEWEAFAAGIASLARERERQPNDFEAFLEVGLKSCDSWLGEASAFFAVLLIFCRYRMLLRLIICSGV